VKAALRAARAGARRLVHSVANRFDPPSVVLLYHRVAALSSDPHSLAVHPARFREQMETLVRAAAVTRFEDLGLGPAPAVAVTFDDGYADNLETALPILESLAVPAAFFVTTGFVESGREFWWDEIGRLVAERGPLPARFELPDDPRWPGIARGSASDRALLARDLHRTLRALDAGSREALLEAIAVWSGRDRVARTDHRPLTAAEVGRLARSPLATVGAHGVTHTAFSILDARGRMDEMIRSKATLEQWTGGPVTIFAFPYGERGDVPGEAIAEALEAGFAAVALNQPGQVRGRRDRRRIPRFVIHDWSGEEFGRRLRRMWSA